MPSDLDSVIATLREKRETAQKMADFYTEALRELEGVAPPEARKARKKPRTKKAEAPVPPEAAGAEKPTVSRPAKAKRATPMRAEVSAPEAIVRLLTGCKMGLPASEIIQNVATRYGYKPNSLSTTLYNLKKKGAIVQNDDGLYNHPQNVG